MPHRFKIVGTKDGQFQAKFVYNGETMVWSENYESKASAKNCIASIQKNAFAASIVDLSAGQQEGKGYRFEIVRSKDKQHFIRFVAANGETMVRSETYASKSSAKNCIASVKTRAQSAEILDEI